MAFNFCTTPFRTTVTSDKVTVDGYEASNLVTNDCCLWSTCKGFLVENFVRSPANLTFEFAFNIEIERVVIHGVVGSQRSCGFEIFSRAQDKSKCDLLRKGSTVRQNNEGQKFSEELFNSIGKFNKLEAETFTFKNNRFRKKRPYINLVKMNEKRFDINKHVEAEIRSRNVANLTRLSHLTIRVNRVAPGCVAAIKWVEIWGQPAMSTPPDVVSRLLQIHKELIGNSHPERVVGVSERKDKNVSVQSAPVPHIDETKVQIPNEFLDAITYEIMMIPMLLPSGYTVDKTTIERHNKEQASWGRVPNDPFTGKIFTDTTKPVSNAALKVRIDQFLLKNGSDIDVKSRTVGVHPSKSVGSVSSLIRNQKLANSLGEAFNNTEDSAPHSAHLNNTKKQSVTATKAKKRQLSPTDSNNSSKKMCSSMRNSVPVIDLTEVDIVDLTGSSASSRHDHERNLSSTLDDALDSALSSLPTFSTRPNVVATNSCVQCGETFQPTDAYQFPCQHKVCRKCLTQQSKETEVRCSECDQSFPRSSVVKVHL